MPRCSSAQATPGAETLRSATSQQSWQSSPLTFAQQEKSPAPLTSSADQWLNNIACWSLRLPALCAVVVPRSWQVFHLDHFDVGIMTLALTVIIAGCVITVFRRFKR